MIVRKANAAQWVGYVWAAFGVAAATVCFWLIRHDVDKGQASLLYLPVVIACAIRFGFGPSILGALLSFLCWDFFFLPPFGTVMVSDPKDWLSLVVFLLAAVTTAQLASRAQVQTRQARTREAEIATLFHASEAITREVRADRLLDALAGQLLTLCHAAHCRIFRRGSQGRLHHVTSRNSGPPLSDDESDTILKMAEVACEHRQVIGFGRSQDLWTKALGRTPSSASSVGVYVPLQAEGRPVGVLHVGRRLDGLPFSAIDERLILTLANHAAVVIAREDLAAQAAQAEALREADTLKDSLLSLVSHELRTPLAAIKASVTGLLDPRAVWDDPARTEGLQAVNRETDRLTAVVSNLLDLSRLEAGAWRPQKDWCDIAEIVGTVLDRLPDVQAARVQICLSHDLPLVQADYTQIALVLINLLENAVKYTPAGTPIRLAAGSAPGGVTLTVSDDGPGIAPGEEEHLFERFYRGAAHRDSTVHGTGLGLALCRAIVQAHGGRIWAANASGGVGMGAVFSIVLPIDRATKGQPDETP